jgi:hypothetical protein
MSRLGRVATVGLVATLAGGAFGLAVPPPEAAPRGEPALPRADEPAVRLAWTAPAEMRVNVPAAYGLTVTNTGGQAVQKVVVQVRVPAGVTASDTGPAAKTVGGVLLWELGTLQPREERKLTMNLASPARGALTPEAWVTFTGAAAVTVPVREPKLVAELDVPATVAVGESFEVKYRVRNAGDGTVDGLRVSLDCPHSHFGSIIQREEEITQSEDDRLPAGREQSFTRTEYAREPGEAWVTFTAYGAGGVTATAKAKVKVLAPKLDVKIDGPVELGVTKSATYTVTVTNTGDLTAEDVNVATDFAAALRSSFKAAGADAAYFYWEGSWRGSDQPLTRGCSLKPGESGTLNVWATGDKPGDGVLKVAVTAKRKVTAAAECRTVVRGVPGIRMEVVDSADPVKRGGETVYEIKVANTGTATDRNLRLVCNLPQGMTLADATGPVSYLERVGIDFNRPGPKATASSVTFEPVRELGPKTEVVFKVRAKAGPAGDARFKASLTSDHLTTPVTKEESTTVYGD